MIKYLLGVDRRIECLPEIASSAIVTASTADRAVIHVVDVHVIASRIELEVVAEG